MPKLQIIDVNGQPKLVTGTHELQRELDLYDAAFDQLTPKLESEDDVVGEQAMNAYRGLISRYEAIVLKVPEFNRLNRIEVRQERKRVAAEIRQRRANRA